MILYCPECMGEEPVEKKKDQDKGRLYLYCQSCGHFHHSIPIETSGPVTGRTDF